MASDNFNRASLGANWTDQNWTPGSPPGIVSNIAFSSANLAFAAMFWSGNAWNANQRVGFTVKASTTYGGPAVRSSGVGASNINLYTYSAHGSLQKFINGAQSVLGVTPPGSAINDVIEIDVTNTTLTTYKNGVVGVSTTDSAIATGSGGVNWFHTGLGVEDWFSTGDKINSTYTLDALPSSVLMGGSVTTLRAGRVAGASSGSYSYAGTTATLRYSKYNIIALGTSFAITAPLTLLWRPPFDFDAAATGSNGGGGTLTFSHTCTGSLGVLLLGIVGDAGLDDLTAITYNNVPFAFLDKKIASGGGARWAYFYGLVGPATGVHDIKVTSTASHLLVGVSASYVGAKQSAQPETLRAATFQTGVFSYTTSLTPTLANCWVTLVSAGYSAIGSDPTAGTGATRRINDPTLGLLGLFDSNQRVTAGSPYDMTSVRISTATAMIHFMASFVAGGVAQVLTALSGSYAVTGAIATLRVGHVLGVTTASYTSTGTTLILRVRHAVIAQTTAYTETGTAATIRVTRALLASSGAYTATETDARLARDYTAVAGSATYTASGTAATLRIAHVLGAQTTTYTETGTAATLRVTHAVLAGSGTYTATGTAATLRVAHLLVAQTTAYTEAGTAATLRLTHAVLASSDAYTWTGTDARLAWRYAVVAESGAYALTATGATLTKSGAGGSTYTVTGLSGTYAVTSLTAQLLQRHVLSSSPVTYTASGTAATLRAAHALGAQTTTYTETGTAATLRVRHAVLAGSGASTWTGTGARLAWGHAVVAGSGTWNWTRTGATLRRAYTVIGLGGTYAVTSPATASLMRQRAIPAAPGAYATTGATGILRTTRVLFVAPGTSALAGASVTLHLNRNVATASQTYAYDGTEARLVVAHVLTASEHSFVVTGLPATLRYRAAAVVPADLVEAIFQLRTTVAMTAER